MRRTAQRALVCMLALTLAFGLMPARALALGEGLVPGVHGAQPHDMLDSDSEDASTSVYMGVVDDFQITGHSTSIIAQSVHDALEQTDWQLWASVSGGSGVASASWSVYDEEGDLIRTFQAMPDDEGRCALALTAEDGPSSLALKAPSAYECVFTATDRSQVRVQTSVHLEVLAPGESSEYERKTVYKDHVQTFDGVATYAEPSATGLIHEFVTRLGSLALSPSESAYESLVRAASEHAADQGFEGAYAMMCAWQLEAALSIPREGDPVPYAGALEVVLPIEADAAAQEGIQASDRVSVFHLSPDGAVREPIFCQVRADAHGDLYVAFETSELGAFGIARYRSADQVSVIATASGSGFINYEGRYTWARDEVVRYVFTPIAGWRLASIEAVTSEGALAVPALAPTLGYWDLDLSHVPADADLVRLSATFEELPVAPTDPDPGPDPTPPGPDDPDAVFYELAVEVAAGTGEAYVNGVRYAGEPVRIWEHAHTALAFAPLSPSVRAASAEVIFEGQEEPLPLALFGQSAYLRELPADALVRVFFDSEPPAPVATHTVTLTVEGGHGSIDSPYEEGPATSASRTVAEGGAVSFTVHPQEGWCVYTIREGAIELGSYLATSASNLTFTMPDVHRDHDIIVTFEQMPVSPSEEYATIRTEALVDAGSERALPPIITPPEVVVPLGQSYTFAVIPANSEGILSSAWAKEAGCASWRNITAQVEAAWTLWPEEYEGMSSTGYYALALEDVRADTFVRVSFRDSEPDDPPRPPTPTRNVTIEVQGEGGMVYPNTMGTAPLRVPVGKPVQVSIVREDGCYLSQIMGAESEPAALADRTDDDVLAGEATYTIPDNRQDQAYTFVFSERTGSGPGGDEPTPPGPGGDGPGGNGSGGNDPGGNGPSTADPAALVTVTPVIVPASDGKVHGAASPAGPVKVRRGDALTFSIAPDAGWRVARVEANGRVLSDAAITAITLSDIQEDTELRITLAQRTQADAVHPALRPIHTLQALAASGKPLAQTGDAMLAVMTGLVAAACAAAGAIILMRRRCRE